VGKEESEVMSKKTLTDKQEKFCQEVAAGASLTDAALRAGYSADTCGIIGWQNMQKLYIRERISELQGDVAQDFSFLIWPAVETLKIIMEDPGASESARVAAAREILRLTGAMVDRSENKNLNKEESDPETKELLKKIDERLEQQKNNS
jgi:phage terminase small subunit